jgi:DNA topoisomerase I
VWICADERCHIQATGVDDRGRKQYIYHPDWIAIRDRAKFDALPAFGRALPELRRRIAADLDREDLELGRFDRATSSTSFDLDRAVALVLAVMDETLIRVGNRRYTEANRSYGLTTLRKRHVEIETLVELLPQLGG